ncbi:MAG: SDR family NAD(P)-dependent oxidoreductase [Muribaculaceae bacterium]|nr:SDR family NAD(P)-dependent oxidoreductase [Muribaculaceae bacterium]
MDDNKEQAIIITGATGSIGRELAKALSTTGRLIILAVRNTAKGESVAQKIMAVNVQARVMVRHLDLSDTESVKIFAEGIIASGVSLYGLINNAGVMNRDYSVTPQGLEATMGVNLINTALLTQLLIPYIIDGGHVVFMTSLTRKLYNSRSINIDVDASHFSQLGTYGRSKTALTHYALHLSRKYPHLNINCADPGVVNSDMVTMKRWYDGLANIIFRPFIRSPRKGAKAVLRAMTLSAGGFVASVGKVSAIGYNPESMVHKNIVEAVSNKITQLIAS